MCQRDTKRAIELITKRGTTPTEMTKIADTFSKSPMLKRLFKSQSISEHNHQHLPLFFVTFVTIWRPRLFFFWVESHVKSLNWNVWTKCDRKSPCLSNPFSFCLGKNSPKGFGSSIVVIHIQFVALLCEQDLGPASGQILSQITDVTQCCGAVLLTTWSLIFFGGNSQWSQNSLSLIFNEKSIIECVQFLQLPFYYWFFFSIRKKGRKSCIFVYGHCV